jgi:hypothetical protein
VVSGGFANDRYSQGQGSVVNVDRFAPSNYRAWQPLQSHPEHLSVPSDYGMSQSVQTPPDRNYCHSPLFSIQNRQTNQKHTIEEGDFTIYAFLDKKRWEHIL